VSAGNPEMSHLVVCCPGRPALRFRFFPRRIVSGRVFARPGWLWRTVGAGGTLALQSGLEEPRDPMKGRGGLGPGLGLVDLAGMLLTHDGGGGGGGGWRQ